MATIMFNFISHSSVGTNKHNYH